MDFAEIAISATQIVALTEVIKKFFKGKSNIFYAILSFVISIVIVLSSEYLPEFVMTILMSFSLATLFYDSFLSNLKVLAERLITKKDK